MSAYQALFEGSSAFSDSLFDGYASGVGRARATLAKLGCAGAALVPSKTTIGSIVNLAPNAVAERRVKRLKKTVWASGHLHKLANKGSRPPVCWFVTMTYAKANAWSSKHMGAAVQRFRNWCTSRKLPCRYTWVAEIQPKRAERTGDHVVHYHLLAWLPAGLEMPNWQTAEGRRAAFWPHGRCLSEVARSGVGYLMKYLSKLGEFTRFPKGLRLYGIGGLDAAARSVSNWLNLPEWAKSENGVGDVVRAAGRYVVRATGELLEPAFRVSLVPSGLQLHSLRTVAERFHSGPYSSYPPRS